LYFEIEAELSYKLNDPSDLLLQIEVADCLYQHVESSNFNVLSGVGLNRVSGEENIGERMWLRAENRFTCAYSAIVNVTRPTRDLGNLKQTPLAEIPGHVLKFLMPSRYCIPEDFFQFTAEHFADLSGGSAIEAIGEWIEKNFIYAIDASDGQTGATSSFNARSGVCRDYAHVLIAMARAVAIPARFVSAYALEVKPQDFHALAEVYLDNEWHMVDATGMSQPEEIAIIGVGRDAADVSFLTTYGFASFERQSVRVTRTP